ncbi:MAG: hypothetical protein M3364_08570 [Actinomycetota bacterium]|nr:hypothetical protein [Actinomycetota bacterium]
MSGIAGAQHGGSGGHLPTPAADTDGDGDWGKIDFISKLVVPDFEPELIADVGVDPEGEFAYLARWGGSACAGPENVDDGGVYVVDIRDLENPELVTFIKTHQDTLVGEGLQIIDMTTPKFTGEVLLMNHEGCGKNFKAGVSLWDVTNPAKPKKLSEHFGDITIGGARAAPDVNQTHSAFMWNTAEGKAYLISVDDEEAEDVDVYDITDPKHPKLIAELDLNRFDVSQPDPALRLTDSFLHDLVVKEINGRWIGLLSYWDGGWVLLDLENPASPTFLSDTDYPDVDPELLAQTGVSLSPEGNGHQAEFTSDNRFVIGTDEDFDPYRFVIRTAEGDRLHAKIGTQTAFDDVDALTGTPVFVGRACPGDPAVPEADAGQIAVVERGLCTFEEKAQAVIAAGYETMIIFNREGADGCTGVFSPFLEADIPTLFIGRDAGFDLFDQGGFDLAACLTGDGSAQSGIPIGTEGDAITDVEQVFDGWGYVHLFSVSGTTLTEVDTFAIPEAMDPDFAEGFGDLTVHEVAVDPQDSSLAYLSYYDAGLRAVQITCISPADPSTCDLVEVGGFIDPAGSDGLAGNDFWGVETFVDSDTGDTIILASDRDTGLWIFRDP